jgi:Flp pilus assembly protein TadD
MSSLQGAAILRTAISLVLCAGLLGCAANKPTTEAGAPALSSESRLSVAEAAEQAGDHDLALSMYVSAATAAPTDVPLQLRTADALARSGQFAQAEQLLRAALAKSPDQRELTRGLGLIYLVSGNAAPAVDQFNKLLAADPRDANALADKGIGLDLLHQHAAAQALYRQALQIEPSDAGIANDLALSLMLEGKLKDAQAVLEPFANGADAPPRLLTNLAILKAANDQAAHPQAGAPPGGSQILDIARVLGQSAGAASLQP